MRIKGLMLGILIASAFALTPVSSAQAQNDIFSGTIDRTLTLSADGTILLDGQKTRRAKLDILADKFVLRYQVVDKPQQLFELIRIVVELPAGVTAESVKPTIFAVHGVDEAKVTPIDSSHLEFTAQGVGEDATVTFTVDLPSNSLQLAPWKRLTLAIERFTMTQWLVIALILPALIILYVVYLLAIYAGDIFLKPTPGEQKVPPSQLPPAMAGLLLNGTVGTPEIAATVVDLARRGYLDIVYRGEEDFGFSQKKNWQDDKTLQPFEKFFLSQLLDSKSLVSEETQINQSLDQHIWNDAISQGIDALYGQMEELGYLPKNSTRSHLMIRSVGILIFFFSVIGLAASLYFFLDQPLIALPWIVGMIASPLVTRFALVIIRRTPAGRLQAQRWLAFKSYLSQPVVARYAQEGEEYERWLAYAIAFGVEGQWTARVGHMPCQIPSWFYSQSTLIANYQQLATLIFSAVGVVSRKFAQSRRPTAV